MCTHGGRFSYLKNALTAEKAPYIATLLFAAIGWTVTHTVDRWLNMPLIEYDVFHKYNVFNLTLENITDDKVFENFFVVLRLHPEENVKFMDKNMNNVVILKGNSKQVINQIDDNSLDWVYIDGNHSYDNVLSDLNSILPKMKKDGIIAGDDYFNAIGKFGNDVINAVNDFCKQHNLIVKQLVDQYMIKS